MGLAGGLGSIAWYIARSRSRGNGRAVRMVDGPVMPAPPPIADVVADEVAKAEERVDLVIRVFVRLPLPFFGVDGSSFAACLSSACAWERTLSRRRW